MLSAVQPSSGLQKALESGKGLRNVTRRCAEPPVLSSRAALGLLNDRLPHLSNTSLGAVRISVPGFESYAVAVLQVGCAHSSICLSDGRLFHASHHT